MREQIGDAAERRHTAPIASVTLWAAICGVVVIAAHFVTTAVPGLFGSYRTGIITIISFAIAAAYSARKRSLWFSVRWLRLAMRLPRSIARRMVLIDRLETWRTLHITFGVIVLLPFWWHLDAGGTPSVLERALESTVVLVILSGLFGVAIHDLLPRAMRIRPKQEVRLQDVEAGFHQLYTEAEEAVLGHSEDLVHAYLANVRPLLVGSQPLVRLAWATLRGTDPAPRACRTAILAEGRLSTDRSIYGELVEIAERKVRLEHNQFNLRLGTAWLKVHIALIIFMTIEIAFHVAGVLYFLGF